MYIYHRFLIHLSVDGHSGGFHILAIVNNTAMNIGVHVYSFQLVFWVSLDKYPEVELLVYKAEMQIKTTVRALARYISWLECRPITPKSWVRSPVRVHTRINQ